MSRPDSTLEARALALLDDALDRPSDERAGWIDAQTPDDPALRQRTRTLLAAAERDAGALLTGGAGFGDEADDPPPERIGAYRITGLIGQGGMGAVYRGERDTGDFSHVVAIKIIRPGVLSAPLIERFERERQILADLAHPGIARLFDGGRTEDGRPFIVMEHVVGRPLTDWAEARSLGLRARVELMLAVCDAVRFAHQNLIVHRDLTPSNVLVGDDGRVKLIDFGIARPPQAEAPSDDPGFAALSHTPGFAAPERMTGTASSTLVDIYSLGRLLQELIEGAGDADLAAVVARATAADPDRRYASVDALMDDLRAWLSGRPVLARGGGRRYAIGKFVRRHRRTVLAAAAGITLLVAALAVTLVAYGSAVRARAAEAERFNQVRALANHMLFELNPRLQRTPGNTQARVRLAEEAQRYLTVLADTPGAGDDVRLEAARGLIRLAQAQGVPPFPNFGEKADARASLDRARDLLSDLAGRGADPALLAPDQARRAAFSALLALHGERRPAVADAELAAGAAALTSVPAPKRGLAWFEAQRDLREAELEAAYVADGFAPLHAAIQRKEADLAAWPAALRGGAAEAEDRALIAYWRGSAQSFDETGDRGVAELQRAHALFTQAEAARRNDPHLLYWLVWTDYSLFSSASQAERLPLAGQALARARASMGRLLTLEDSDQSLLSLSLNLDEAYAQDLGNQNRFEDAIATQQAAIRVREQTLARVGQTASAIGDLAFSRMTLGVIARKAGRRDLACDNWAAAETGFLALKARDELVGFHATFLPGIRANLERCADGQPVTAFTPLT